MTNHTPGKWNINKFDPRMISAANGNIAKCQGVANALRIVHCVNLHDELVESLEALINAGAKQGYNFGTVSGQARAAIAKAHKPID